MLGRCIVLVLLFLSNFGLSSASWFSFSSEEEDTSVLVSPIVNRQLEASVVVHDWPSTVDSVACEAWAFHDSSDWDFMDRYVDRLMSAQEEVTSSSSEGAMQLVLEATSQQSAPLLEYSLSLRAYSPQCELHRGLARQVLLDHGYQTGSSSVDAFVVTGDGSILTSIDQLEAYDWKRQKQQSTELLSGEVAREGANDDDTAVAILYANMTSQTFVEWYRALVKSNVAFVVRHLGHVWYEDVGGGAPTVLQGYGVRLDIRNVEYRVFDDRDEDKKLESNSMINVTSLQSVSSEFLAGVNVSALALSNEQALILQQDLYKMHEAQQLHAQIIPPKWQRRQLSLQAASAVAASSNADILLTLQDVSQNLPSVASTLVHIPVQEDFAKLAEAVDQVVASRKSNTALYVNGRRVPIGRPSFNVFEFLNMLKEEQAELKAMQVRLSPYLSLEALLQVQAVWSMGPAALMMSEESTGDSEQSSSSSSRRSNDIRIDVGRGWKEAVLYVNDIEKDDEYARWPRQVRNFVFASQMGMPPAVRRNLFTVLGVMDPVNDEDNPGVMLASQLMQSSYPLRLGVLIVSKEDVQTCAEWVAENQPDDDVPCPADAVGSDLTAQATAQAAFSIMSFVVSKYYMAAESYVQYWLSAIAQHKEQYQDSMTLQDLVNIHGQLMSGMHITSTEPAVREVTQWLKEGGSKDDDEGPTYGMALRFAASKGLEPGMSFLNGRPLPAADTEKKRATVSEIFMEEQSHIVNLIMNSEITDTSPKSVYASLLTGDKVFERLHPLLTASKDGKNAYVSLSHGFGAESLLVPKAEAPTDTPEAIFLVEAVADLESSEGVKFAATFIEAMEALPGEEGGGMSLAYRMLPSTASSAASALCTILSHASKLDATSLRELLKRSDVSQLSVAEILDAMGLTDDAARDSILSDSSACSSVPYLENDLPTSPFVTANGRVYAPEQSTLNKEDMELLLNLELSRTKGVTKLLLPYLPLGENNQYDAVAQTIAFLVEQDSQDQKPRSDIERIVLDMEQQMNIESNPLRFAWNEPEDSDPLKIKISAVVDPISESTQRMVPLLRAVRDHLKLPLSVILAPEVVTGGDIPITSYYRFVADPQASPDIHPPRASFSHLPANHVLTLRLDVPESWNVQQTSSIQDTDNLRCDVSSGCGDHPQNETLVDRDDVTRVEYGLKNLLVFGQCYDSYKGSPPNGLQLTLSRKSVESTCPTQPEQVEVGADGSITEIERGLATNEENARYSDTLVMKTVGYWQLRANPGVWNLTIAPESRGAEIFDFVNGTVKNGKLKVDKSASGDVTKTIVVKDFVNRGELLVVKRRPGYERATLFYEKEDKHAVEEEEVINVFSLATGHLYERFLKIMMLSVTKRTSTKVKFWLFENFLSPTFKASAIAMAERIGCEVEFVTYKWPEWLRGQSEKQRIIWGYKILFLDVLFPLKVKKIIYVDADQVVRGDLKELWDMDLHGAPYGYTPMCSSRESTLGFQFWRSGFWKNHLGDKPYHISALYVVDLDNFRRNLVGDQLRAVYQQLSADPNSLANLDQDLPNYAQHQVPIFSLPQEWLWCESWCSDETKADAKTIDLCNNPLHKEPKVSMAKRIISGALFNESWVELDEEVERYDQEYLDSLPVTE